MKFAAVLIGLYSILLFPFCVFSQETNLAKGLKPMFSTPSSNSKLELGSCLTDGVITENPSDVGKCDNWGLDEGEQLYICLDLKQCQSLDKVRLYVINNTIGHWRWTAPARVELVLSKDGQSFYRVGTKVKVNSYGTHIPQGAGTYRISEIGSFQSFPVEFSVNGAEARYVGLAVKPEGFAFWLDELEVTKAKWPHDTAAAAERNIYGSDPIPFYIGHGLAPLDRYYFGPDKDVLAVARNARIPGTLEVRDYTGAGDDVRIREHIRLGSWTKYDQVQFILDLPAGLTLYTESPAMKASKVTLDKKDGRNVYRIQCTAESSYGEYTQLFPEVLHWTDRLTPIVFEATRDFDGSENAEFYVIENGKELSHRIVPVKTFEMPFPGEKIDPRIHLSIGWLWPRFINNWPGFFETYGKMGFNAVPIFPSGGDDKATYEKPEPQNVEIVKNAQAAGFKIIAVNSPLHGIYADNAKYPGSACTIPGKVCPSYTGEGYVKNMDLISHCVSMYPHDYVFYDCEVFSNGVIGRASACPVCSAAAKAAGKTIQEYLLDCGERIAADWQKYYKKHAKTDKDMNLGVYYLMATLGSFEDVLNMRSYPKDVKYTMPEFYGAGILAQVAWMAKHESAKLGGPWHQITWASTGTFGEYEAFKVEPLTLELLLNGSGITFFADINFDTPEDFRYFAQAVKKVAPYQELLLNGRIYDWQGKNKRLNFTVIGSDVQQLLLVGNYVSGRIEKFKLEKLPMEGNVKILEITDSAKVERKLGDTLEIPPQGFRLFEVSK